MSYDETNSEIYEYKANIREREAYKLSTHTINALKRMQKYEMVWALSDRRNNRIDSAFYADGYLKIRELISETQQELGLPISFDECLKAQEFLKYHNKPFFPMSCVIVAIFLRYPKMNRNTILRIYKWVKSLGNEKIGIGIFELFSLCKKKME